MILNLGCGDESYGDVRVDLYPSKTTTHVMNIEKGLPKKWSNKFDIVYSKGFFEHLKNPFFVLTEMKRVCKPGGKIILITDNAAYWEFHILGTHNKPTIPLKSLSFYKGRGNMDTHYCLYTKELLKNHFKAAGIKVKSISYLLYPTKGRSKLRLVLNIFNKFLAFLKITENFAYPLIKIVGEK